MNQNKMKAKLIKEGSFGYKIKFHNDNDMAACALGLLSLKNCQAIERGYDLDELVKGFIERTGYHDFDSYSYKLGFQKALELMGDKKFSEEDIRKALTKGYLMKFNPSDEYQKTLSDFIQSLQQTEWDVIVEMICPHPMDTYRCGLQYGCDGDGCNHLNQVPLLDADGCLILKRKV